MEPKAKMEFSLALVGLMSLDLSQDYLNAHNAARAQVGVGPKTWDNNVSFYAQSYAKSRMGDCNPINSGGPYEENLAMSSGLFTDTDAVNLSVREKPYTTRKVGLKDGTFCDGTFAHNLSSQKM
ncbi:hypothetical protein HYC85_015254 [Camellia sinensis]|uniref:SCP domain-containing protein n=1 Tax=Camellia sinensis TaxID=4442 RepID=A0A7J7GZX9_CAMSI|nr:hypothetical protein HYC85_015254 [Camellia sinensis]